jgi:signal transduction histidine kinase/ActR/RegA family two-component response regulator
MKILDFLFHENSTEIEEKYRRASFLKTMLIVALSTLPVLSLLKIIIQRTVFVNDAILVILILLLILFYFVLLKNKPSLTGILFILSSWICMTFMAWAGAGVYDVTIISYILIVFIATLITGLRMALLVTGLSIISVWIFAISQHQSFMIPTIDEPLNYGRDFTVLIISVVTLIFLYAKSFRQSYERINKELLEKTKAEVKLREHEMQLKTQNEEYLLLIEELNESNQRILKMNHELNIAKEKAEESDRLKSAFIQNISHEIRTPLNSIIGFTELLKNHELSKDKRNEFTKILKTSSLNLTSIINDIMDIAKIDAGAINLSITQFNINTLILEVREFYSQAAADKGISITYTNDLTNFKVRSDKRRIYQILSNLISNAVKFTHQGYVKIHVYQVINEFIFSVYDSGIGINTDISNVIFDRFRQGQLGENRQYGGTGLGLSIAKGLVEYLGGRIWVESQPGKGSVFSFSIPVDYDTEAELIEIGQIELKFIKKLKILIVEDEEINFECLSEMLLGSDCEIIRATDGLDAIEKVKLNSGFDVILMDLKMPQLNGYEATRTIKEIMPEIPVIAVTALALGEERQKAIEFKFDAYITKPVIKNQLFNCINKLIQKNKKT